MANSVQGDPARFAAPTPRGENTGRGCGDADENQKDIHQPGQHTWLVFTSENTCQAGYEETRHHVFRTKDTAPEHAGKRWTHLRLCQFPDGGIARLRVYGTVSPHPTHCHAHAHAHAHFHAHKYTAAPIAISHPSPGGAQYMRQPLLLSFFLIAIVYLLSLFRCQRVTTTTTTHQVVVDFAEKDPSIPLDLLAVENGGVAVGCSNQHFGHPRNLGKMGLAPDMGDGWETARHPSRPVRFTRECVREQERDTHRERQREREGEGDRATEIETAAGERERDRVGQKESRERERRERAERAEMPSHCNGRGVSKARSKHGIGLNKFAGGLASHRVGCLANTMRTRAPGYLGNGQRRQPQAQLAPERLVHPQAGLCRHRSPHGGRHQPLQGQLPRGTLLAMPPPPLLCVIATCTVALFGRLCCFVARGNRGKSAGCTCMCVRVRACARACEKQKEQSGRGFGLNLHGTKPDSVDAFMKGARPPGRAHPN